jgi:DNA-binding transcriptional regulator LsrR (DeoR family)
VISRAITAAFRDGLVDIVKISRPQVRRLQSMEQKILDKYPNLWEAVVVDADSNSEMASAQEAKRIDDEIHRKLGYAMAGLTNQWRLRDNDVISFGSGRGVFYTVEGAMQLPAALRVEGLHLVSLTGAVHARDHAKQLNTRLDADLHVCLFGMCIRHSATLHLVTHPITAQNARTYTCLGEEQWPRLHCSHAVIGVGVLAEGHRFYEEAKAKTPDPILEPILPALRTLVDLCDTVTQSDPSHYPVADICNHLFLVDKEGLPAGVRQKLSDNITIVNNCLLNVSETQLQEVGAILLVAGTRKKAAPMRQLLNSPSFKIRIISVDSTLAEELARN